MSYEFGHPGYEFTGALYGKYDVIEQFNGYKPVKKLAITVSNDDVEKQNNVYGTYYFVSKGNDSDHCVNILQYFGTAERTNGPGNQRVRVGACWNASEGGKAELEAFVHDLMARVRFDDGAINKAKAASAREYNKVEHLLNEIERLLDEGTISPQEARKRRKEIIEGL